MVFANPPTNQKRLSWPENYLFLHSILLSDKEMQRRDTGRDLISLIILLQAERWLRFGEIYASETTRLLPPPRPHPSHGHFAVTSPQDWANPSTASPRGPPQMALHTRLPHGTCVQGTGHPGAAGPSENPQEEDRQLGTLWGSPSLPRTWSGLTTPHHWSDWFHLKHVLETHTGLGTWRGRNEPAPHH